MSINSNNVSSVVKSNLCCSCGLCSNYCKQNAITYKVNSLGFYEPIIEKNKCTNCKICIKNCPGINDLKNYTQQEEFTFYGHSTDQEMHINASSGGIATELLCYLISHKIVDYVTCVTSRTDTQYPEQIITNDLNTIKQARTSKYCPIKWDNIINQIEKLDGTIAIMALPCQINSLKSYVEKRKLQHKIKFYLTLFCNHTPSLYAAEYIAQGYGGKDIKLKSVINRGSGFPGYMNYSIEKGHEIIKFQTPYRKTWSAGYGLYFKNLRCSICNDPFGKGADIAMGDSYFLQDSDTQGNTFCIIRNKELVKILSDMEEEGIINIKKGPDEKTIFKYYRVLFEREEFFLKKNKCLQLLKRKAIIETPIKANVSLRYLFNFYKETCFMQLGKYRWLWPWLAKRKKLKNIITNIQQ